jgi:hypothetical protein
MPGARRGEVWSMIGDASVIITASQRAISHTPIFLQARYIFTVILIQINEKDCFPLGKNKCITGRLFASQPLWQIMVACRRENPHLETTRCSDTTTSLTSYVFRGQSSMPSRQLHLLESCCCSIADP